MRPRQSSQTQSTLPDHSARNCGNSQRLRCGGLRRACQLLKTAADPDVSTRAQNVGDAQLTLAPATVPSWSTDSGTDQVPERQVDTDPSDRATRRWLAVGHRHGEGQRA